MMNQRNRTEKPVFSFVFLCMTVFFLVFLLNQKTVYTADDYMYHFFWERSTPSEFTREMDGIGDLPLSLKNHYEGFNGRVISHAFVMFFMMFDKTLFDFCNSLMYLALGFLLLLYVEGDCRKWKPGHLAAVYMTMWAFLPAAGQSVFWLAGACNYLWTMVFILVFFLPYHRYMERPEAEKHPLLKALVMLPLGAAAGCSNENTGGAVVLLAVLFVLFWLWKREKVPFWSVTGILSAGLGVLFLVTAPSSQERMGSEAMKLSVYLKRIREIAGFSFHHLLWPLMILGFLTFCLIRCRRRDARAWAEPLTVPFLYCLSGAASVAVLIASPVILGKSWILAVCFVMIAAGMIYKELAEDGYLRAGMVKALLCLLAAYTLVSYVGAWRDIGRTHEEVQQQIQMIEEQKRQGITDVEVYLLTPSKNLYNAVENTPNVAPEKDGWFNRWMAYYYGVDSITGLERVD